MLLTSMVNTASFYYKRDILPPTGSAQLRPERLWTVLGADAEGPSQAEQQGPDPI